MYTVQTREWDGKRFGRWASAQSFHSCRNAIALRDSINVADVAVGDVQARVFDRETKVTL